MSQWRPVEMFTPGLFEPSLHLFPVGLWLFATGLVISPGFWLFPPSPSGCFSLVSAYFFMVSGYLFVVSGYFFIVSGYFLLV